MPPLFVPLAGRRPRRRVPRALRPSLIELDYARALLALVARVREAFEPVLAEAPALLEAAARERADARTDAGEGDRLRELVEAARQRIAQSFETLALETLARSIARRTEEHQQAQLRRQVRSVLGVDVLLTDRKLAATMNGFVAENVSLIKADLGTEVANRIEKVVTRGVSSGLRWPDIAKDVDASFEFGRKRAHFIARDQVGKFYGQVNETRQKELGLDEYVWRTSRDRRVRGDPAGKFPRAKYSHFHREGVRFKWSEPPPDGHPGEPVICRCYAEPVFDPLLK